MGQGIFCGLCCHRVVRTGKGRNHDFYSSVTFLSPYVELNKMHISIILHGIEIQSL